jgi:hypothetical protein
MNYCAERTTAESGKQMQTGWSRASVTGILVMVLPWAQGQAGAPANPAPRLLLSSSGQAAVGSGEAGATGELVREIDDPHSGDRWLLTRDPSHPGGPGLLRLVASARGSSPRQQSPSQGKPAQAGPSFVPAPPAIRCGDRVIVEEHRPVVDARLEAVAMSPARAGSVFNARLTMGGRVVRAVAIAPGRAVLVEKNEADKDGPEKDRTGENGPDKNGAGEKRR